MELLAKLFGTGDKVKIMRLFVLNPDLAITTEEVARRSRVALGSAKRNSPVWRALIFAFQNHFIAHFFTGDGAISLKKKKPNQKLNESAVGNLTSLFLFSRRSEVF